MELQSQCDLQNKSLSVLGEFISLRNLKTSEMFIQTRRTNKCAKSVVM